ncbi:MAG: ferritin [Acidimicrobiia bacterium]|nr:ferritin [Acidimicrobiia bacterium]
MRMPDDLEAAFNDQITMELASSAAYLQMSAFLADANLDGMSAWMRAQSEEEREHALRFLDFVLDRGNRVTLTGSDAPRGDFEGPEEVFATALGQEEAVTKAIHDLYRLASERGDLASYPFLQEFIQEQNEEETTVASILERIRMAGDDSGAMLILDNELGSRAG